MDTENVLYSYDWQGDLVEGVYEAKGVEVNNAAPLVVLAIKRQIAAKLFDEERLVMFELNNGPQVEFGRGKFQKGRKAGQITIHIAYDGRGEFNLDVYEAGEPVRLVGEQPR